MESISTPAPLKGTINSYFKSSPAFLSASSFNSPAPTAIAAFNAVKPHISLKKQTQAIPKLPNSKALNLIKKTLPINEPSVEVIKLADSAPICDNENHNRPEGVLQFNVSPVENYIPSDSAKDNCKNNDTQNSVLPMKAEDLSVDTTVPSTSGDKKRPAARQKVASAKATNSIAKSQQKYIVSDVLDYDLEKKSFLVSWSGFPASSNTWQIESEMPSGFAEKMEKLKRDKSPSDTIAVCRVEVASITNAPVSSSIMPSSSPKRLIDLSGPHEVYSADQENVCVDSPNENILEMMNFLDSLPKTTLDECPIAMAKDVYCVKNKKWYKAKIIAHIRGLEGGVDKVKVHFQKWNSKFDESIEVDSGRIQPIGLFTDQKEDAVATALQSDVVNAIVDLSDNKMDNVSSVHQTTSSTVSQLVSIKKTASVKPITPPVILPPEVIRRISQLQEQSTILAEELKEIETM